MVSLTRINHQSIVLNSDLVEHLEPTPDTVITMVSGQKFVVLESPEEVVRRIVEFRRALTARTERSEYREGPDEIQTKA
jgi:flagellar protein FlbD